MFQIALSDLDKFLAAIAITEKLYLPVERAGEYNYGEWKEGTHYNTEVLHTVKSAKSMFFPQSEDLIHFKRDGLDLEIKPIAPEDEDFVVFGLHACDVKAIEVLDRVFISDFVDKYYKSRREHATIFSIACHAPEETCFCGTFGIDATEPKGDVQSWISGDKLIIDPITDKGKKLIESLSSMLTKVDDSSANDAKAQLQNILQKLPLASLTTKGWGKDAEVLDLFNRPEWKELSDACLGCGTCTFVCPTCQCYDIREYKVGGEVQRFRCWDSCMYSDFTMMAAANSRPEKVQRFRQRFMHKLKYYPDNNDGMFSCVGCGRCLAKCPVSINIAKVMKKIGGGN